MTEGADRDLLHAEIDGELTETEASRLHEQMAGDPAARARLEDLRRLADLVEGVGEADPPDGLVDRVMESVAAGSRARSRWAHWRAVCEAAIRHQLFVLFPRHSEQRRRGGERLGWIAGWAGGGAIVAKKALWVVAGLAVVVFLVVLYYNGTRTVNRGAEGTIGAADRYRGAQPSAKDVAANQAAAQQFLQSDLFDRIVKDKNIRNLLADREACDLIAKLPEAALRGDDGAAWEALGKAKAALRDDQELYAALKSSRARVAVAEMEEYAALTHKATKAALMDEGLLADLRQARAALKDATEDQWAEALRSKQRAVALAASEQDPLEALRKNARFKMAMAEDQEAFLDLLKSRGFRDALDDEAFLNLLKTPAALSDLEDANFAALMKNHRGFMDSFDNAEFAALMHDPQFLAVLGDDNFMAAFRSPGFQASLKDYAAVEAALRAHPEAQ